MTQKLKLNKETLRVLESHQEELFEVVGGTINLSLNGFCFSRNCNTSSNKKTVGFLACTHPHN